MAPGFLFKWQCSNGLDRLAERGTKVNGSMFGQYADQCSTWNQSVPSGAFLSTLEEPRLERLIYILQ